MSRRLPARHPTGALPRRLRMCIRAGAAGHEPGPEDARITATAAVNGFRVVTYNRRHVDALGVPNRRPFMTGVP